MDAKPYVVTISHQLGSGGAYLGEKLAGRLCIPFLDREILKQVARQLDLAENEVANREEHLSSFWQNFARTAIMTDPTLSLAAQPYSPSDSDLFELECATIQKIAVKESAVFMGRCGWYVLRSHPRHVSILVTAEHSARVKRLCELYQYSQAAAEQEIRANDHERADYIRTFTKQNWLDARLYDLCVNTSAVGLDSTVDLAENCVSQKLARLG
ncbi:MAG: cytidylate kinase-like family protein [Anaerolineaceae bacterium]|nr:cytidylate kinase-like family protein [Anaerolineaceae bacterium]